MPPHRRHLDAGADRGADARGVFFCYLFSFILLEGGEEDYFCVCYFFAGADLGEDFFSVHFRHGEIKEYHIGALFFDELEAFFAPNRPPHTETAGFQLVGVDGYEFFIIVDD